MQQQAIGVRYWLVAQVPDNDSLAHLARLRAGGQSLRYADLREISLAAPVKQLTTAFTVAGRGVPPAQRATGW